MTKNWTCPQCGAEVVGEVWQPQLCPRCLVGAAIEAPPDDTRQPDDRDPDSTDVEPPMLSQYRVVQWIGAGGWASSIAARTRFWIARSLSSS